MRSIILAAILLSGCTPPEQPRFFNESTGMMDSNRDAYASCEHLLIQAGKAGAEIDPRALWDWCMVQVGAAI